jgi:hypothetical protein
VSKKREQWRKVLEAEIARWSTLPWPELISQIGDGLAYEVQSENRAYQVEVAILEDTADYLNVSVSVDDGSLPASIVPATGSFLCQKNSAL